MKIPEMKIYLLLYALLLPCVQCIDDCPEACQQMTCKIGILTCPSGGLLQIPSILPPQATKVLLTNHKFDSSILTAKNFSNYGRYNVVKLTILNCSITAIEPGTFSHLLKLQTLDLSKNKIKEIESNTFSNMSLNFLRLDENKNIVLRKHSFSGLKLKTLSLIDCDLSDLNYESFVNISDSLERLSINQNDLRIIDFKFSNLFRGLSDLELNNNPLDCSCDMKWLSKVLLYRIRNSKNKENEKKLDDSKARCATPQKLSNRHIYDLKDEDFICGVPNLVELDLFILTYDMAKISCITSSNHNTRVMWTYNHNNVYKVISNSQTMSFNSTVTIKKKSDIDQYFCVAQNENGNSTAEIRIKWPISQKIISQNSTRNKETKINISIDDTDFFFRRQFTLLEMIGGVVGTFTGTLFLFILIYRCFIQKYRKESRKKKLYETVFYSDSQTYDIPHHTPYYPVHTYQSSPAHYLDFKNPQVVNNRQIL